MEKRFILAFVLSFLLLYAFRALFAPTQSNEPPIAQAPAPAPVNTVQTTEKSLPVSAESATAVPAEGIRAEKPEEVSFETARYAATFSNLGGVLKSYKLKDYFNGEGHPLELINQEVGDKVGWPLALVTGDKAVDDQLKNSLFAVERTPDSLVLEFGANGVYARKTLHFDAENYQFTVETKVLKDGKDVPHEVVWQGSFGDQSIPQDPARQNAIHQTESAF